MSSGVKWGFLRTRLRTLSTKSADNSAPRSASNSNRSKSSKEFSSVLAKSVLIFCPRTDLIFVKGDAIFFKNWNIILYSLYHRVEFDKRCDREFA